jgi:flagellar basal body-associated protein FliL
VNIHAADDAKSDAGASGGDSKKDKKAEGGDKKDKDKKEKDTSSITGGRFDGDPVYLHMQPVFLPVVTKVGAEQLVTLMVDLRLNDIKTAENLRSNMPVVRDALMQELYGGLGNGTLRDGNLINVYKLKAKIASALNKVMPGTVQEVLIQAIAQRKL